MSDSLNLGLMRVDCIIIEKSHKGWGIAVASPHGRGKTSGTTLALGLN